jgi:hypothetical protein
VILKHPPSALLVVAARETISPAGALAWTMEARSPEGDRQSLDDDARRENNDALTIDTEGNMPWSGKFQSASATVDSYTGLLL